MKKKAKLGLGLDELLDSIRSRAREHREKADALDRAAQVVAESMGVAAAPEPVAVKKAAPKRKKAAPPAKLKPSAAPTAKVHKLRAPHAPDEPRKLVGGPPRGAGLFHQTCDTDQQRTDLLASLKGQGLVRTEGRLVPGTYDVVWKDGVSVVYWRLALEKAS